MKLAIRQAKKGVGRTSPNPAVGAVVVNHGEVVGRGYHRQAGGHHAEINALRDAGAAASGATLYVTLEPCNHYGRTPPCTRAILASGIRRLVAGMPDPNPGVAGGGNAFLMANGIEVQCGVMEEECRRINRPFIKHVTTGLPWVILKAGASLDGKIALRNGSSGWITGAKSRTAVHRIRNTVDAILVGVDTAILDNPSLTTRLDRGTGRDPLRVVVDTHLRISAQAAMLRQDSEAETIIYCGPDPDPEKERRLLAAGALVQAVSLDEDGHVDLAMVLSDLGKKNIQSLLVEGGSRVHGSFVRNRLADQFSLFVAPVFLGSDGVPLLDELALHMVADACRLHDIRTRRFDDDLLIEGYFN